MKRALAGISLIVVLAAPAPAEDLTTVRVGEQDTCRITGVTTVKTDWKAGSAVIRFDLSKLPGPGRSAPTVRKALLRMWVDLRARSPLARAFHCRRWDDPGFDGFKVYLVGGGDTEPLDTFYPFVQAFYGCHQWDVTAAVRSWLKAPAGNKGLRTNFPLPDNAFQPAWQRPYLQITSAGPNPNRPPQPADFRALYRHGQVFLTWRQIPHKGAFFDSTYRIYRHTRPITAENLDRAERIGEVHRNSQLNYRRTTYAWDGLCSYGAFRLSLPYLAAEMARAGKKPTKRGNAGRIEMVEKVGQKRYNFVIDDRWPEQIAGGRWLTDGKALGEGLHTLTGPQLSDDTGLFVWTVKRPGKAHFAVTSVLAGNENRRDFSAANRLAEGVAVKIAPPRAVLQLAFHGNERKRREQYRQYAYWEGGGDGLHHEPSTPFLFMIKAPRECLWPEKGAAARAVACRYGGFGWTLRGDAGYVPPTRLSPFPSVRISLNADFGHWREGWRYYYGTRRPPASAEEGAGFFGGVAGLSRHNFYGYHDRLNTGADPRRATVLPYLENRVLREIDAFLNAFCRASRHHVLVAGQRPAMNLGLHHPRRIASVSSAMESPWTAKRTAGLWVFVGRREWKLKNDKGFSPWDWNDPIWYSRKFPSLSWPWICMTQSPNYDRSDNLHNWRDCGYPQFYLDLAAQKRGGRFWWVPIGDAPDGKGNLVPGNRAYPAFTNVNFAETPRGEWKQQPRGTINGYLAWGPNRALLHRLRRKPDEQKTAAEAMKSVDAPRRFEMCIRIGTHGLRQNGADVPPTYARFGRTDVTLWRLQQFKVEKGREYLWENRRAATGQLLQAGTVRPDDHGRLTVPGFLVDKDPIGNKLILAPAAGRPPPEVDPSIRVAGLGHAEYVARCDDPVLMPRINPPSTTVKIGEFTRVTRSNPDGSATYAGTVWGGQWGTDLKILKAGHYVIKVRAKGNHAVSRPLLTPMLGGYYGTHLPTQAVESPACAPYYWYAPLTEGRMILHLAMPNEYYMASMLTGLSKKRLTLADVTLTHFTEERAKTTPIEIRLSPTNVTVPAGLPVVMRAEVLNALGRPMPARIAWTCRGGSIDGEGRFLARKAGPCTVTASGASLTASTTLTAGQKHVENFDEGSGYLRPGWVACDLAGGPIAWRPPPKGHHMLNALEAVPAKPGKSTLLWRPGSAMTDLVVQADVILRAAPARAGAVHGLVVRAAQKGKGPQGQGPPAGGCDHYRLEVERREQGSIARLVRRVGGKDTVLAAADRPPPLAEFDWKENPCCPNWRGREKGPGWLLDRIRLQAAGEVLRAWVNGKEVFAGGVRDAHLAAGAPGLYAQYRAYFDNVEIKAAE